MFENQKPIQKNKLHDQVFQRLCILLRQGKFTPGEAVPVARVSQAFGVSAMPVREALTRLLGMGVLTSVFGRSVGVPRLNRDELDDLRKVRLQVETTAVQWAVANRDPAFESHLGELFSGLLEAEKSGNVPRYIRANYEFHFCLYEQANSPVLLDIINTLWLRVSPHLYHLDGVNNYRVSNVHHRAIVHAVRAGDAPAAAAALTLDISGAYDDLVQALFGGDPASPTRPVIDRPHNHTENRPHDRNGNQTARQSTG